MTTSSAPVTSAVPADSPPPNRYASSPARPRVILWWGIGLLAGVALIGLIIALFGGAHGGTPPWQAIDQWWRDVIGGRPGDELLLVSQAFDWLGHAPGAFAPLLVPMAVLLVLRHWRSALYVLSSYILMSLLTQGVKKLVGRARPLDPLVDAGLLDFGSFPSGHAATIGMLLIVVAAVVTPSLWRKLWWVVGGLFVAGMLWQRIMVGAHWASDAVAGAAVGAAAALIAWYLFYPAIRRDFDRSRSVAAADAGSMSIAST